MENGPSEDQEFLRETTRKFLEAEAPLTLVRSLADDPAGFDRGWWRRGAELGWTSMLVPEAYGGGSLGGGLTDLAIVAGETGRMATPGPLLPTNVVAAAVAARGTEAQRKALLPAIVTGDVVAAWALFEPGGVWRTEELRLTAEPRGGGFVLRGTKAPVEAAGQADQLLVAARTPQGPSQFLVPADAAGLTCTPMHGLDLVRRFGSLHFDEVEVPASALLGSPGEAAPDVERQLQIALALQCAESVGAVDAVFESTLAYMFDRFSFGRPLASYQALKHRFADMKMWLEGSLAIAEGAAHALRVGSDDAAELVGSAKAYVGEQAIAIIQDCIQMHGGMGVTWEHDIHLYLRRATLARVLYGTPSEHRERIASLIGMDESAG